MARTGEADEKNGVILQVQTLRFNNICMFDKQSSARCTVFVTAFLGVYWPVAETIVGWLQPEYQALFLIGVGGEEIGYFMRMNSI